MKNLKNLRMTALCGVALLAGVSNLFAGPFGLEFGMQEDELSEIAFLDDASENGYFWLLPPKPSPSFDEYYVRMAPSVGVFEIQALGKILSTSAYGDEIRAEFRRIETMLVQKYGQPTSRYDSVKTGSAFAEPKDWMKAIQKGDRYYESYWVVEDGADLPGDMNMILLKIDTMSDSATQAYLTLIYEAVTWDEGDAELALYE